MTELIRDGDGAGGAVIGAVVERDGRTQRIGARGGVILASGGFDHDMAWRREHLPVLEKDWSFGNPAATGDGIRAGEKVGASTDLLDEAWWFPAMCWPDGRLQFMLNERMMPSQFVVNGAGKRFINEAAPYMDFAHAMIAGEQSGVTHIPCWLITDKRSFHRYVVGGHLPIPKIPFAPVPTGWKLPKAWLDSGIVKEAGSWEELAAKIGVPADALRQTATRFNELAHKGHDDDFNRGDSAYDNYYGDPTLPNPNLHPIGKPPYYAFQIILGDLGTSGGLRTDEFARVLRRRRRGDRRPLRRRQRLGRGDGPQLRRRRRHHRARHDLRLCGGPPHRRDRRHRTTDTPSNSHSLLQEVTDEDFPVLRIPAAPAVVRGRRAPTLPARPRRGRGRRQGRLLHGLAHRAPLPRGVLPLHRARDVPGRSQPAHQGHSARLRRHAPAARRSTTRPASPSASPRWTTCPTAASSSAPAKAPRWPSSAGSTSTRPTSARNGRKPSRSRSAAWSRSRSAGSRASTSRCRPAT